jgi:multiple sugar transport system permease protein/cellobiose transport system permease protein
MGAAPEIRVTAPTPSVSKLGEKTNWGELNLRTNTGQALSPMRRINKMGYWFVAPFLLFYLTFNLYPVFYSLWLSFYSWNGLSAKRYVGFANYLRLFTRDPYFLKSIGNTLFIMAVYLPVTIILGLLLATLLYNKAIRRANVFQTAQFLPYIIAPVCVSMLFKLLFDWSIGMVNQMLINFHIINEGINWLGSPHLARFILIFLNIWSKLGYVVTLFLAGMTNISPDVLEAADVDGASYIQKLTMIIIPLLKPILMFVILTGIIDGLQMFDAPQTLFAGTMTKSATGGPGRSCLTAVWYMVDTAFGGTTGRMEMGYAAAVSYGLFLIIAVFSYINYRIIGRGDER